MRLPLHLGLGLLWLLALPVLAETPDAGPQLLFEPPEPGSYVLPVIQRVQNHELLGPEGRSSMLLEGRRDRATVVSFVYRSCSQATGCPLALAVLRRLDRALAAEPDLGGRVRLVTVSFDPAHDTPERMAELRSRLEPKGDWHFLTSSGEVAIAPVLEDFGQDAVRLDAGLEMRHVLKVFLVDGERGVRNIYSAGFLSWRILMNDIRTVLLTGS